MRCSLLPVPCQPRPCLAPGPLCTPCTLNLSHPLRLLCRPTKRAPQPGTGDTPLIVAAANGRLVAVQVLLAHGCDVDAASNYDWTALDAGVKYGHTAVVQTLKAADARHYADTVRDL